MFQTICNFLLVLLEITGSFLDLIDFLDISKRFSIHTLFAHVKREYLPMPKPSSYKDSTKNERRRSKKQEKLE